VPIKTDHYGYQLSDDDIIAKTKRNNDLLFEWLKENPSNAYALYQIGQTYFMLQDFENAQTYFKKSLDIESNRERPYVHTLIISYSESLLQTGRLTEADELLQFLQTKEYQDDADYCCCAGSIHLAHKRFLPAMGEFVRALYAKKCSNKDATHNIPMYNIGVINERLGDFEEALKNYHLCNDFPLADKRIRILEK
jgi:tetratricopeptide (TPR) repeat protein